MDHETELSERAARALEGIDKELTDLRVGIEGIAESFLEALTVEATAQSRIARALERIARALEGMP